MGRTIIIVGIVGRRKDTQKADSETAAGTEEKCDVSFNDCTGDTLSSCRR